MRQDFEGKVVVVTGDSRDIGRTIAYEFASDGAQTVLAASRADSLTECAKVVTAAGGPEPVAIVAELDTIEGCRRVFAKVNQRFGRCDVLINNAGAPRRGDFLEQPDEVWLDGFALKFFSTVRLTRLFWPLLKAARGNVVNIADTAPPMPATETLVGAAVNAALTNFSKGLADLGNRDDIHVNTIHPGDIAAGGIQRQIEQQAKMQSKAPDAVRADLLASSGIRRIGLPEDVAQIAVFLCRPAARHIQGETITVDGATKGNY